MNQRPPVKIAGEQFDTDAQQYYLRARYYNQNNGRFNRTDPFAGNNQDPQSLHKYLYAHNNPVNAVDPSGLMSITNVAFSMSIGQMVFAAAVAFTYVAVPGIREAAEDATARQIELLIATAAAMAMSLERLYNATRDIVRRLSRSRRREVYLHYGYRKDWAFFFTSGLLPGKYATKDIYLYGWFAKWCLALPGPPRNAVYVIWPKKGFGPTWSKPVDPDFVSGMPGGGYEYFFAKGSGGFLTAFGPIPIPTGSRP